MTRQSVSAGVSGMYVLGVTVGHLQLLRSYGGLVAAYLSEGQFLLVSFLAIALATWIVTSLVPVETQLFVPISIGLPVLGVLAVQGAYGGGNELHPATLLLLVGYVISFLAGIGVRQLLSRRVDRIDRVVAPIARRKREIVAGGGLLLIGGAAASAARRPSVSIVETRPTNEHASVYLAVRLEADPADLRLVLDTPTDRFDDWISRPEFEERVGTGTVRMAAPSATPPAGEYDLRIETVWTRPVASASFVVADGPRLEVTGVSVGRDRTEFGEATTVAFDIRNGGDATGVVWKHGLDVDGEPHRILHDVDVVHPGESATIAGPIGTHPSGGGSWKPALLDEGEYAFVLEVRSMDRTLLTDERTVDVSYENH